MACFRNKVPTAINFCQTACNILMLPVLLYFTCVCYLDVQDIPARSRAEIQSTVPTLKYEKKKRGVGTQQDARNTESNALRNWQMKMLERKRQQGYISSMNVVFIF